MSKFYADRAKLTAEFLMRLHELTPHQFLVDAANQLLAAIDMAAQFPTTKDGVTVYGGSDVYTPDGDGPFLVERLDAVATVGRTPSGLGTSVVGVACCYSTREAAIASTAGKES